MGAQIEGIGSDALTIVGGRPLTGAVHTVMPDRIELGTVARDFAPKILSC